MAPMCTQSKARSRKGVAEGGASARMAGSLHPLTRACEVEATTFSAEGLPGGADEQAGSAARISAREIGIEGGAGAVVAKRDLAVGAGGPSASRGPGVRTRKWS